MNKWEIEFSKQLRIFADNFKPINDDKSFKDLWGWIAQNFVPKEGLPVEAVVMQKIASIKEQALKGLLTDGGHHKQWFLEAILGMLTTEKEWLYLQEKEQWQKGIAP